MGNWIMKRSQLFLCLTFTRLHVTKYLPFVYSPPLPSNLLSPKGIMSKWIKSHRPALPCPSKAYAHGTGIWQKVSVFESYPTLRQLCSELSGVASFCTCHDKPAQHMCCFFLPLWHGGHRATWHSSADIFQVFSLCDSSLTNVLGQIRTLPRMSLH